MTGAGLHAEEPLQYTPMARSGHTSVRSLAKYAKVSAEVLQATKPSATRRGVGKAVRAAFKSSPGICRHSRRPSCSPSAVNSDRIWASFLPYGPGTAWRVPGAAGRRGPAGTAMPARAAMAVPQAAGAPAGSAQAPTASEGRSRKPAAKSQNRYTSAKVVTSPSEARTAPVVFPWITSRNSL